MKKIKNSRFGKWLEKPVGFLLGILMVISPSPLSLAVDPLPVSSGPSLQPTVSVDANGVYVLTSGDALILKAGDFINEKRAEKQNRNGALDGAEISISANRKGTRVDIALDRSYAEGLSASVVINGGAGEPNGKTIEGLRPIVCSKAGNRCVFSIEGVEVSPEFDLRIIFKQGESVVESKTKNMKFTVVKPPPVTSSPMSGTAPGANPVINVRNVPEGPLSQLSGTAQTPAPVASPRREEAARRFEVESPHYQAWVEDEANGGSTLIVVDKKDPSKRYRFPLTGGVQRRGGSMIEPAVLLPSGNGNHSFQSPLIDPSTAVALPRDGVFAGGANNGLLAQPRDPFHPEPNRTQPRQGTESSPILGPNLRGIEITTTSSIVQTAFVGPSNNLLVRESIYEEAKDRATGRVVYQKTTLEDRIVYTATLRDPEVNDERAIIFQSVCQGHPVFGWSCTPLVDHPSSRDPNLASSPLVKKGLPISDRFSLIRRAQSPEAWERTGQLGQVVLEPLIFDHKTGRAYGFPLLPPQWESVAIEVTGPDTLRMIFPTNYLDPLKKTYVQELRVTRTEYDQWTRYHIYPPRVFVEYRLDPVREYHSAEPLPQRNSTGVAVFSPACGRLSRGGILDLIRTGGRQEYYCLS